jgi:retron-type reverse transcriptase
MRNSSQKTVLAFRPKRGAHDALRQCQKNVNDGYVYVVDMDLEKFFDTVCQSKLIEVLSRTIKDGRVISLDTQISECGSNRKRNV